MSKWKKAAVIVVYPRKGVKGGSTARGYTTIAVAAQLESAYPQNNPANLRGAQKKSPGAFRGRQPGHL